MPDTRFDHLAEYPVRSVFLTLGQVALVLIAVAVAAGLVFVPTGTARLVGGAAAIVVLVGAAYLVRSLRRQAVVVDGQRLGWRRGLTAEIRGWTDLADVEGLTVAKASTSISLERTDVILWTRVGGMRGIDAVLLRPQLGADARRQLDASAGSDEQLHPFLVPFTAMRPGDREVLAALLRTRGLLPG